MMATAAGDNRPVNVIAYSSADRIVDWPIDSITDQMTGFNVRGV